VGLSSLGEGSFQKTSAAQNSRWPPGTSVHPALVSIEYLKNTRSDLPEICLWVEGQGMFLLKTSATQNQDAPPPQVDILDFVCRTVMQEQIAKLT
jgi:hypothetical protein